MSADTTKADDLRKLIDDVIAQTALDIDDGLLDYSAKTQALIDRIVDKYGK